jgi:polyribonucleotide nucleotidyltransferase
MPTDLPYTIRIVSDILESNGSSSMATVCAGILALMDAGVQIRKPVSGIAMGLISNEETGKYVVLSDILGDEDHLGDMDFKVCGTEKGITACQMDIKIKGLSRQLLTEALEQAKRGRLHILGEMKKTLSAPREDYKPHAPRVEMLMIDKEYIGAIIGPGGKVIQEMQRETGTTIQIEEIGNGQGKIEIFSPNRKVWMRSYAQN